MKNPLTGFIHSPAPIRMDLDKRKNSIYPLDQQPCQISIFSVNRNPFTFRKEQHDHENSN